MTWTTLTMEDRSPYGPQRTTMELASEWASPGSDCRASSDALGAGRDMQGPTRILFDRQCGCLSCPRVNAEHRTHLSGSTVVNRVFQSSFGAYGHFPGPAVICRASHLPSPSVTCRVHQSFFGNLRFFAGPCSRQPGSKRLR